ncbi:MAG: hypothetical protein HN350_01780 [Phycisphaerales bacterium]|jgi:hypothetical protein|nr:hypothetical protein [Phycisphaerales bacterium]
MITADSITSKLLLSGVLVGLVLVGVIGLAVGADSGAEKPVTHRYLKAGWASGGPAILAADGKFEWQLKRKDELSDAWVLADGGVAYSYSRRGKAAGIVRLDKDKKEMWTYTAVDKRDNHSCQPLPGGGFLTGETLKSGAWMVEIDKDGKKVKEVKLDLAVRDPHHTFRHVRKTKEGTYLAAIMNQNKTYEWDAAGKVIRTFPNGHYAAVRLPNGNTLTSGKPRTAEMGGVTEYDKDGKIVWALTKADFEKLGLKIKMICGLQRLPNGNTVFSNVSHGSITKSGKDYKILEITRDKKLVWFVDDPQFKKIQMGSIQILDVKGDPTNFEVFK